MLKTPVNYIGHRSLKFLEEFGEIFTLLGGIIKTLPQLFRSRRLVAEQMMQIGVGSLPLVMVIGVFTGAVSAWQAAYQFKGLMSNSFIGSATSRAIFLELGPVLTGIVIAGRVGASIAAEIGTMKVTEQIDALKVMAISPVRYLAMPRFIAAISMLPILVIFADTIALFGSFFVSNLFLDVSASTFFASVKRFFLISDLFYGVNKSIVFGGMTALIGCHIGLKTEGGAEGVGNSTIRAFVISSACILIADGLLWSLFFTQNS